MDPKSQVAEGLELKKRGEVTISQPWQRHPPGGDPKGPPSVCAAGPGFSQAARTQGPHFSKAPRSGLGTGGRRAERGARGGAGTGGRFLPPGARAGGAQPRAQAGSGQGQPSRPPPRSAESRRPLRLTGSPLPTARLPTRPRAPHSPSPGYRWPAAPTSSAVSATSSGAAAAPRPRPGPMAAGARSRAQSAPRRAAGLMLRGGRRGPPRVPLLRRRPEGPRSSPGAARGLGRWKSGGAARAAAWVPALRPGLLALGPKRSGPRSAGARTNGQADGATGGRAGGHRGRRAGGGSEDCSARKQRRASTGPRQAARKDGADPNSEGTGRPRRGLRRGEGGRAEGGAAPPSPLPPSWLSSAPRPRLRARPAQGAPILRLPNLSGSALRWRAPKAQLGETDPVFNMLLYCSSWPLEHCFSFFIYCIKVYLSWLLGFLILSNVLPAQPASLDPAPLPHPRGPAPRVLGLSSRPLRTATCTPALSVSLAWAPLGGLWFKLEKRHLGECAGLAKGQARLDIPGTRHTLAASVTSNRGLHSL